MSRYISRVLCFLAVTAATFRVVICEREPTKSFTCFGAGIPSRVVAGPGEGLWNATDVSFGSVIVFDQRLTATPDPSSKYLGQCRGFILMNGITGVNSMDVMMLDFANDEFNGTVSILGTEDLLTKTRQVPIVGGSGDFLFVNGYILVQSIVPFKSDVTEAAILYGSYSFKLIYQTAASLEDF